jgi:N-acetylglucosaminyl-diphospho-decaprenol L-rhamnosyltransferase
LESWFGNQSRQAIRNPAHFLLIALCSTVDLSIVIVNWNVYELLRHCLLSLSKGDARGAISSTAEVVVVDCASSDGSAEMVQREFPWVKLIASDENLGYSRGNNLGMTRATGRHLMILNPDTEVKGDALATMVRYLDEHPGVGALGPELRYPDGTLQSSRRRFPTLATAFFESTLLHQWFPHNRVAQHYHLADRPPDVPQPVDWLVGAALMIRREVWQKVGPLDEGFFMYFEELDWCRRCRAQGWQVHYLPTAQIIHFEGKSSEQVMTARSIRFQSSKIRYFRKYYGKRWALVIRLFLMLTFALQLGEESLKWLVGHKRGLRLERIVSYWHILRSGLTADSTPVTGRER